MSANAEILSQIPVRVQRKRTKGYKLPENTKCVNRGTKWGNPFKIGEFLNQNNHDGSHTRIQITREISITHFEKWIKQMIRLNHRSLEELKGKNLACFCNLNEPCHADILLKLANE